jgi:hypothetical protein
LEHWEIHFFQQVVLFRIINCCDKC